MHVFELINDNPVQALSAVNHVRSILEIKSQSNGNKVALHLPLVSL